MKLLSKALTVLITICAAISCMWVYIERNQITFTCIGQYSGILDYPGKRISNTSNIVMSVTNSHKVFFNVDGTVTQNGQQYHLSRDVWFRYEPIDIKSGLFRIEPIRISINSTDNAIGDDVNHYLLGAEPGGRLIRVWKLNDSILLIGNPFTPVYSCLAVNSQDAKH